MRNSRGSAITGLLLIGLGLWGALIPFVGSYFGWVIGTDQTWDWTAGRFWLSLLPGIVTIIGGLLLMGRRASTTVGATLAIGAGVWFVVGSTVSRLWNEGVSQTGPALGGTTQQVLEQLTYFSVLGVAITFIGSLALSRHVSLLGRGHDDVAPTTTDEDLPRREGMGEVRTSGRRRRLRHRGSGRIEH
ncbi:MAG TPA: hypothetical protein VNT22_11160 [Baekduia sp.]|nr:hypothetical protein [Baekduia sp.]